MVMVMRVPTLQGLKNIHKRIDHIGVDLLPMLGSFRQFINSTGHLGKLIIICILLRSAFAHKVITPHIKARPLSLPKRVTITLLVQRPSIELQITQIIISSIIISTNRLHRKLLAMNTFILHLVFSGTGTVGILRALSVILTSALTLVFVGDSFFRANRVDPDISRAPFTNGSHGFAVVAQGGVLSFCRIFRVGVAKPGLGDFDFLASGEAGVPVSLSVVSAHWGEGPRASRVAVEENRLTLASQVFGGTSAVELTLIIIGDSFGRANGVVLEVTIARRLACIVRAFKLMDTMHKAQVFEIDVGIPGAHGVPLIRALAHLVLENQRIIILDAANAFICQVDVPVLSSTVVSIGDSVDAANWQVLIGAVGLVFVGVVRGDFDYASAIVRLDGGRFI